MANRQDQTSRWVDKFCGLIEWLLSVHDGQDNRCLDATVRGKAANYLAVRLGIGTIQGDRLPLKQSDFDGRDSLVQGILNEQLVARLERWLEEVKEKGVFRELMPPEKDVTDLNIGRFINKLKDAIADIEGEFLQASMRCYAREMNGLAVKLGLTHPDWFLAMELGLMPFLRNEVIKGLPLQWDYDPPPFWTEGPTAFARKEDIPRLELFIQKAEALASGGHCFRGERPSLQDLEFPVKCTLVQDITRIRSDNVVRKLRSHGCSLVKAGSGYYCQAEDAAVIWPKWKKYWSQKKAES